MVVGKVCPQVYSQGVDKLLVVSNEVIHRAKSYPQGGV